MAKRKPIVELHPSQTHVRCGTTTKSTAIKSAYRVTMSPHEHEWTRDEQRAMAHFCLWAHQRLSAIEQCVRGDVEHGIHDTAMEFLDECERRMTHSEDSDATLNAITDAIQKFRKRHFA